MGKNIGTGYKTIVRNNIISNVTNGFAIENMNSDAHTFISEYNNLYNNANNYSNVVSTTDISVDPMFVTSTGTNPDVIDLHLKSVNGRWNGTNWINDEITSQCIDGGSPTSEYSNEPTPNGNRVNIGAYGNTSEASKG